MTIVCFVNTCFESQNTCQRHDLPENMKSSLSLRTFCPVRFPLNPLHKFSSGQTNWNLFSQKYGSVRPSVRRSVRAPVRLSNRPSVRPSICPSLWLSLRRPSVRPPLCLSVWLTVHPSDGSSVRPSICPSIRPSVSPTVCPTVWPSVRPGDQRPTNWGIWGGGAPGQNYIFKITWNQLRPSKGMHKQIQGHSQIWNMWKSVTIC